jgi:hypothetical protein
MPKKVSFKEKHVSGPPRGESWVWHTAEMIASNAWRSRSINLIRLMERLELEHMMHAGKENGRLKVSYSQFVEWGIGRRFIRPTIDEGVRLGFIEVTPGLKLKEVPNAYRLTYLATNERTETGTTEWHAPTNEWRSREIRITSARRCTGRVHEGALSDDVASAKIAEKL